MGLLGNYSVLHKSPGRFLSGNIASGDRYNFSKSGRLRNRFLGDQGYGVAKFSALPNGYVHPYSWSMAQISGGLASYKALNANISTTDALLALGINIDADLSAQIVTTDVILALIVALQADLSASGTITDANMAIIILLEAALSASGTITTAELQNIVSMIAALSATGTLTNSITNLVNLSADISNAAAGLNVAEISSDIFDGQDIETGYTLRESLRLILAALAGKVSGAGTTTITIRDVNDAVDRIVATVDANGNRSVVTKDVT